MNSIINYIFLLVAIILAAISFFSGLYVIVYNFILFRVRINRALNMDLAVMRISKIEKPKENQEKQDEWKEEIGVMEQLLVSFSTLKSENGLFFGLLYGKPHIAFEIANASGSEEICFYIAFPRKLKENAEKLIHSFFPNVALDDVKDYNIFTPGSITQASFLSLKKNFFFPILTYKALEVDPLNALANSLSKLNETDEGGAIQLILRPTSSNWRSKGRAIAHKMQQGKQLKDVYQKSILTNVSKGVGELSHAAHDVMIKRKKETKDPFEKKTVQLTPEEQELVKSIDQKAKKVGFETNIRLVASAANLERAQQILSDLENAFAQYENYDQNSFKVLRPKKSNETAYNFIFRNFIKSESMILNTEEISSIFHLPVSVTDAPKIKWLKSNVAPPPNDIPKTGVAIGFNEYRGVTTGIRLTVKDRGRHFYTIGQTGTGKTTILQEMAKQDAKSGNGFCFIDPHGEAVQDILASIPKERAEEVVYFDPADVERPFGLNMMEYDPAHPEQKSFVINEMIGIFDQLYDLKQTGGPMFEQYMRNAMLLVMEDPDSGNTLMEIPKVLADENFRRMKLSNCKNPTVIDFWTKEAEKAGGEAALANMVP